LPATAALLKAHPRLIDRARGGSPALVPVDAFYLSLHSKLVSQPHHSAAKRRRLAPLACRPA
jgi:hypothetical protein